MQAIRTVRVVLGEGQPGVLRLVLEAQGFEVVGHARDDEELLRVLDVTRPSVVVLDAGISALAASAVDVRSGGAQIVVVWPKDVVTSLAAERVEPATAILELGNAVRRAAARHVSEEPILIPEAAPAPPPSTDASPQPTPNRARRMTRQALVAVAAWVLSLTALGAIGLAIPKVVDSLGGGSGGRPSIADRTDTDGGTAPGDESSSRRSDEQEDGDPSCTPDRSADPQSGRGRGCGRGRAAGQGPAATHGKSGGANQGKGSGRSEEDKDKGKKDKEPGSNGKRPDDPGAAGKGSTEASDDGTSGGENAGGRGRGTDDDEVGGGQGAAGGNGGNGHA